MCGITGFISNDHLTKNSMESIIKNMTATLNHRGPDDTGFWFDLESFLLILKKTSYVGFFPNEQFYLASSISVNFNDGMSEAFDTSVLRESSTPGAIMPPK